MQVYFLRHGKAFNVSENGRDEDRALTPEGIQEIRQLARKLNEKSIRFDVIFTSPFVRARQTAELIAQGIPNSSQPRDLEELASGAATSPMIKRTIAQHKAQQSLLFVGHMPDLGIIVSHLTQKSEKIGFKPGTLIGLDDNLGTITLRLDL